MDFVSVQVNLPVSFLLISSCLISYSFSLDSWFSFFDLGEEIAKRLARLNLFERFEEAV